MTRNTWRVAIALSSALVLSAALARGAEPAKPVKRPSREYTIEQFMATTTVMGGSFTPDEKAIVYTSNASGVLNAWSVPVSGGPPKQLTDAKESTFAVACFPGDGRIILRRDRGGDENFHVIVRETDGTERDMTPGEKVRAEFLDFSGDDRAFYLTSNERDPHVFDVYRVDATSYARTLIYQNETGYTVGEVSHDGRWLALSKLNYAADSDIFLYDLEQKALKHLSPHQQRATYEISDFDPASKWAYFLTNDGSEFSRVRRYELATGRIEDVEKADWDIMASAFSYHGKYRISAINADAQTLVKVYDAKRGKQLELPKLPEGDITTLEVSRSEQRMLFYVNSDRSPANLYVYEFATRKTTRLTDSLSHEVDPLDLVDSEVVRFKSFDGMQIPSLLYKPHQATPQSRAPAVILVHGGPGGQSRKGYFEVTQYLLNHGYAILAINNRGSYGYGKSFFIADNQKHGKEPLWDCVEGKKYLSGLPWIDPDRVAIMGGSYGGYMTLAALAYQPDVFAAGVDLFGVSNWLRTLESIPPYWAPIRKALYDEIGDPETQKEMLREISPLFHAERIKRPLLVLQGANDPRVLKVESDEIVAALKRNGVPVEYVVFDNEGHGFKKKENQIATNVAILAFLDRYLKAAPAPGK